MAIRKQYLRLGIILLAANYPFGYCALIAAGYLVLKTGQPAWFLVGVGGYALSWLMLVAGFALAGPEGVRHLHIFLKRTHRRLKVLKLERNNAADTDTSG